jgi:aspartate/methionine/tyrosine aminotransferase
VWSGWLVGMVPRSINIGAIVAAAWISDWNPPHTSGRKARAPLWPPGIEEASKASARITNLDLTSYYCRYYQDGAIDLSRSSANPLELSPNFERVPWAQVRPPGGVFALRAAIATHCYTSLGPQDILLCSGASEALVAIALALGSGGRSAVAFPGTYPSFTGAMRALGVRLHRSFAGCTGPACAIATNPGVPRGQRVDVAGFIKQAVSAGCTPIVDEVYRHIVMDGAPKPKAAADIDPAAVSIGDLSKPLGLGGLRVGWLATRNHRIRDQIERTLQLITGGPSVLADIAGLAALQDFEEHTADQQQHALGNAPSVYEELGRAGWSFDPPELGLVFAARPPEAIDERVLARARRAGYFLLPCSVLDAAECRSAVRFSVMAPADRVRVALGQLRKRDSEGMPAISNNTDSG